MKQELLQRFKNDGFYLDDLLRIPKSIASDEEWRTAPGQLIGRLNNIIKIDTPIILIKANVFDILHKPLSEAGFLVTQGKASRFQVVGNKNYLQIRLKAQIT
jgi:hypothetical protein